MKSAILFFIKVYCSFRGSTRRIQCGYTVDQPSVALLEGGTGGQRRFELRQKPRVSFSARTLLGTRPPDPRLGSAPRPPLGIRPRPRCGLPPPDRLLNGDWGRSPQRKSCSEAAPGFVTKRREQTGDWIMTMNEWMKIYSSTQCDSGCKKAQEGVP